MGKVHVSVIAIVARNRAIGINGDQPFHISADFKRFKALTMGKPIIMGRRTFEALPGGALPGRRNIVITRSEEWSAPGAERASSLSEAIAKAQSAGSEEVMIIGGGQVYAQAMDLANRLYITEVNVDVVGADTFFPEVDVAKWQIANRSEEAVDPRSGAAYRFVDYVRN